MAQYTVDTVINAPRSLVYRLFADREHYDDFLPITVKLVAEGAPERQGVGAVHRIGRGPIGLLSEQIIELVPDELIRYRIVKGIPVHSHIGTIELSDACDGTRVRYTMVSDPKIPVPAPVLELALRGLISTFVSGVRKEAARRRS